jgi:hypothetical protein
MALSLDGTTGITSDGGTPVINDATVGGNLSFADNGKALFGAGSDLQIYHTGSDSLIRDEGTGNFIISTNGTAINVMGASNSEYMAQFVQNEDVRLYYDNSQKFATTSTGIAVTGELTVAANTSSDAVRITQTGTGNAFVVEDSTSPDSTPFVITATGNNIQGYTSSITGAGGVAAINQVVGTNSTGSRQGFVYSATPTAASTTEMAKSASATVGTQAIVASGGTLGTVRFSGSDGTNFLRAAEIGGYVDGAPGTGDMPGRLVFSTTADGASSPTERMRIDSAGNVGIGTGSPSGKFTVDSGRSFFKANNEVYALGVQYSPGTAVMYIGATNSATPSMQFSNSGGGALATLNSSGNFTATSFSGSGAGLTGVPGFGVGQSWQAVSRSSGVSYTNTTGKPIQMAIHTTSGATGLLTVGGVVINRASNNFWYTATIPDGVAYNFTGGFTVWTELR